MSQRQIQITRKMEEIIKTYKTYAQIPAVASARILSEDIISTVWTQRNLERGKLMKFSRTFVIRNFKVCPDVFPVDVTNELLSTFSNSNSLRATIIDNDSKQFLEVWKNNCLIRSVDLAALDLHGSVYTDGEFGALEFSPDEKCLLYVAEKKVPKSEPFYKRKQTDKPKQEGEDDKPAPKGQEHLFEQDWGEQLVGKKKSILVQYDIEKDLVQILDGVPDDVCVAQPKYSPNGEYIIGVAYFTEPRKLGLIYCTNRSNTIFQLDFEGNYFQLPVNNVSVKSPIFAPDSQDLVWLQRAVGGPHASCMALVKTRLPLDNNSEIKTIIGVVPSEIRIVDDRPFYGLYCANFPKKPWASENRLFLNSQQKYTINSYLINIDSGLISEVQWDGGSLLVLDVSSHYNSFIAVRRNILKRDCLIYGELIDEHLIRCFDYDDCDNAPKVPGLENCSYQYYDFTAPVSNFNAIFVTPEAEKNKSLPLIVWPHGGPHSAFANYFFLEAATLLSLGYAILLINYRGSVGAGDNSVHFLLGKIGITDVQDCIQAVDQVLADHSSIDPEKLALCGGSHGGFLVTHLSGQYPDKFKAVVARNPVIDVASMSTISDIPDWCYVEAGKEYTQRGEIDNDIFLKMRKASPIVHAHKVKAPTLLQIGSKDLRVPWYQSNEYYCRLKANGVKVRMNLYDDNHPLGSVQNEMDNIINTILWIEEHLRS